MLFFYFEYHHFPIKPKDNFQHKIPFLSLRTENDKYYSI